MGFECYSCQSLFFGVGCFYNDGIFGIPVTILDGLASSPQWRAYRVVTYSRREGAVALSLRCTNGGRCGSGGPLDSPLLSCPPFFNLLYLADRFVIVAGFMALNRFIVKPIFLYHKSCIFFSQKNCLILLDP